jgi:hypothetical protein
MPAEERRGLVEDVTEEAIAKVAHDPLADVGHQEGGRISAKSLDEIDNQECYAPASKPGSVGQHVVDDRLNQRRDCRGRGSVDHHGRERRSKSPAIRPGVPEQAVKRIHSVNRYFSSTHNATKPSRQVIFFPSS